MAPSLFIFLVKIPKIIAGKKEAAAKPNAKATVAATKSGGLIPKYPATQTATTADKRAATNSPFS